MQSKFAALVMVVLVGIICEGCLNESNVLGEPKIELTNLTSEIGYDLSLGVYADCTVTLINLGNADGIATISLETEKGKVLESFDILVPKGRTIKKTVRADIAMSDEKILSKIIQVRRA